MGLSPLRQCHTLCVARQRSRCPYCAQAPPYRSAPLPVPRQALRLDATWSQLAATMEDFERRVGQLQARPKLSAVLT